MVSSLQIEGRAAGNQLYRAEWHAWSLSFVELDSVESARPSFAFPLGGRLSLCRALVRDVVRQLLASRFAIPLLIRLRRDFSFDEKLRELAPLRLALERHGEWTLFHFVAKQ
jgi:hypothetical protein